MLITGREITSSWSRNLRTNSSICRSTLSVHGRTKLSLFDIFIHQEAERKIRLNNSLRHGYNPLKVEYPPYDEEEEEEDDDDDGGGRTTKEAFQGVTCKRCGEEINMYHRYYYNCTECDFSLHKFCGELPERLDHTCHIHPLFQRRHPYNWTCHICQSSHERGVVGYICNKCLFRLDVKCGVEVGKKMIHHPCHPHLLICVITRPILCYCNACGKRHEGIFYQCTTCVGFAIHSDCVFLPETLLIQQTSHGAFHHTHPLTISYSFPTEDQTVKHFPRCRVCGQGFYRTSDLWIYKCDKCMYYAHLDCTTSRREPFMSIFLPPGLIKNYKDAGLIKNYKDADHPHLLHLPFPDETHSIPRHLFLQEKRDYEVSLSHISHQHPLILVHQTQECDGQTSSSSLVTCHDPMKKTQLLCNGCLRPITSNMPFYMCPHPICNFALHEWCTRLPPNIENHPGHPQHTLLLMYPNVLPHFFGVFKCAVCDLHCNGFAYCCEECDYYVDVTCGFIPKEITHKAHPNHLLSLVQKPSMDKPCHLCRYILRWSKSLLYKCNHCDISIHLECALLLAETIRHKYDKHPMHLSYLPIENHKSPYFCEICEEDLNPHKPFYHCQPCVQSVHAACAPLILQSETETYGYYDWRIIYYFVNVKFGGILNTNGHQHPLSFAQGLGSDGKCEMCFEELQYKMIFKCLECTFVICYDCCKELF